MSVDFDQNKSTTAARVLPGCGHFSHHLPSDTRAAVVGGFIPRSILNAI
jgi:hypothetical protein